MRASTVFDGVDHFAHRRVRAVVALIVFRAVAPPVHVRRQRARARDARASLIYGVLAAPSVRRDDHRRWGGFSCRRRRWPSSAFVARRRSSTRWSCRAGRGRSPRRIAAVVVARLRRSPRLYLGVDHPFDVVVGVALGVAIPVNAFRFFTPNEVVPGHLPAAARPRTSTSAAAAARRSAHAVEDQLGLTVLDDQAGRPRRLGRLDPAAAARRGRSRHLPVREALRDEPRRADRWYKLGRTILYGRLEDEAPFQSVRRLVEYEDYTLRAPARRRASRPRRRTASSS